jgi:hypothetical protein
LLKNTDTVAQKYRYGCSKIQIRLLKNTDTVAKNTDTVVKNTDTVVKNTDTLTQNTDTLEINPKWLALKGNSFKLTEESSTQAR